MGASAQQSSLGNRRDNQRLEEATGRIRGLERQASLQALEPGYLSHETSLKADMIGRLGGGVGKGKKRYYLASGKSTKNQ